jgi:hypothetical protein
MNRNNLVLAIAIALISQACAIKGVMIEKERKTQFVKPSQNPVHSFYITGGNYEKKNVSVLPALETFIKSEAPENRYLLFIGDNINATKKTSERLDTQLDQLTDVVVQTDSRAFFVPGHREWRFDKTKGLEKIEDYLREKLGEENDILVPNNGCPLESIEISDEIQLLAIDTEWCIQNWDYVPDMNDKCQIKSRKNLFLEIEGEIKKYANKHIIVAMHHPMFTNGARNGRFSLRDHIFPFRGNIPAPIIASGIAQVRSQGGTSKQDRFDIQYNSLMKELQSLFNKEDQNIMLVSGHDLDMQYIEDGNFKQLISGAGSRTLPSGTSDTGIFSYGGNGFSVIDVLEDGSVWARFMGVDTDKNTTELLFTQRLFEPIQKPDLSDIPVTFPKTFTASVYDVDRTEKTDYFESFWGDHYRKVYGTKVTAPTAVLDTLYGGLTVIRPGGGHQTKSLRLNDPNGKEYNMRALKKSAVQFLETTGFKGIDGETYFKDTTPENLILDFYTAAHPYAAFAIPELAKKARVYYTTPQLFYVPKQKALEKYNEEYGDQLFMIVEKPSDEYTGQKSFGYPDDVESTDDVLEKLREDDDNILDEETYIRARIFDMLIGDWDRHSDQWRWAVFEDENGKNVFEPIPRDRDQVFANFDGKFLNSISSIMSAVNQFGVYGPDIEDVKWFNAAGSKLDRALIKRSGKEVWMEQARFLQDAISQETIDKAFKALPIEVQDETIEEIKQHFIGRKANLVDIVARYYAEFMKFQMITGTDKDDLFEITRMDNGKTQIAAFRIKDGERGNTLFDRTFDSEETEEIWLYGLDDDDQFIVRGKGNNPVTLRIIGGQNKDVYDIEVGRKIFVYDSNSKESDIINKGGAKIRLTDIYEANVYDYERKRSTGGGMGIQYAYNPDSGSMIKAHYLKDKNEFLLNPYTTRTGLAIDYHFLTQGLDVRVNKGFAAIIKDVNLIFDGRYTSKNFTENFFGVGNETVYNEEDVSLDYNRANLERFEVGIGLERETGYGSFFQLKLDFKSVEVVPQGDNLIAVTTIEKGERDYFAIPTITYVYQNFNDDTIPSKGMLFSSTLGVIDDLSISNLTPFYDGELQFYNSLSKNDRLVLNTKASGQLTFANTPKFYQKARIGGNSGLRGYRTERFNGDHSFVAAADVSYSFKKIKTSFLPLDLVVYAGYDIGRVWTEAETSTKWHDDYGGGFKIYCTEALFGSFSTFRSEEGTRIEFGFGISL